MVPPLDARPDAPMPRRGFLGAAFGLVSALAVAALSFVVLTVLAHSASQMPAGEIDPETLALIERRWIVGVLSIPAILVSIAALFVRSGRKTIGLTGLMTLLALLPAGYAGWAAFRFLAPLYQFQELG